MTLTLKASRRFAPVMLALGAALLSGCVHGSTEAIGFSGADRVEAVTPLEPTMDALDANAGLDREDWPAIPVLDPADTTTRLPSYRISRTTMGDSARQTGVWPTPETAATADAPSARLLIEAVLAPIHAAFEILTLPARTGRAAPDRDRTAR